MKKSSTLILIFLWTFIYSCTKNPQSNLAIQEALSPEINPELASSGSWTLIYDTTSNVIFPGGTSGWVEYDEFGCDVAKYQLKIRMLRDIIVGPKNGNNDTVRFRVRRSGGATIVDEEYELNPPVTWITKFVTISNVTDGISELRFDVPPDFEDGLRAQVFIRPYTYQNCDVE